ncbi:P-loop containing nucleoside triphosphate hydrolase protein [Fusarium flagelliforme]|uniref:Putative p-loop containing nucleoside triphosphate hydrolase protein n=1 Tax=Fusarium flagelliforme TaxID=2675880 RepID=A0A395MU75_9HYPO|nr:P-loop containing nucleoside triphosphate hydrolase protein [Fusarium flagelliforme]KAH7188877.1 P-loop containing nucleoside triphosphate hydrolase protein [Fusarium flagelliforme]RFN50983.1 putative p-loop containing nucleoside triphosphate hydrolase protein [Fusarium flagelliforme]
MIRLWLSAKRRPLPIRLFLILKTLRHFTECRQLLLPSTSNKSAFVPSAQQLKIAKLCADQNIVVSARPGSGKTATIEAIAAAHPDKQIGSILFSKRLQIETFGRLKKYHNSHVFTFHGMAGKLLKRVVPSDEELIRLLRKVERDGKLPVWTSTPFDIIVLDEFQDCNPETFWLVACFLRSNSIAKEGQPARIVVLGDERQSLYRFRNADSRYLTMAPQLLGPTSPYPFTEVQLGKSFRLPMPTVQFINHAWLGGEQYISSSKRGPKPIVLRCDLWDSNALAEKLSHLINRYGPQNSVIIAPSIRTKGPLQGLTNRLAEVYRIPISVPTNDDAPLDDQVIHGKMCISTIHQFKGRERELVILLGMDSTYFKFLGRDQPDDTCPNEAFVALTRALNQLVLLHHDKNSMMPCVSVDALYDTAEVINMTGRKTEIPPPGLPGRPLQLGLLLPQTCGVRDMTRYIQGDALDRVVRRCLHVKRTSPRLPGRERINIQNVVASDTQKGFFESVSDINGLAIAASLELETSGTLKSLDVDQKEINKNMPIVPQQLAPWLCRHACEYEANLSGYRPRVIQMEHHKFDWIRHEDLELARRRLGNELADPATSLEFEVEMSQRFKVGRETTDLLGRADIVASYPVKNEGTSDKTIWEIKFVSELTNEHIVQACVYAYLSGSKSGELPRIILYNVRDGDKREITPRHGRPGLRKLIIDVLRLRYTAAGEVSYEEFIERCTETTQKVMRLSGSEDEG